MRHGDSAGAACHLGHRLGPAGGQPAQQIRSGDVVVIEANKNHWHGADATHTMVHLAMQESDESGKNVVWGRHVTDEEYRGARQLDGDTVA
ncbi:hypothetical protein JAO29_12110 [Edaphobacter sp. HDX4]|uniref:hypothetical protein n=1 Tax=Edaphobacter sp. HDX4 TaxID=2794064 RepID=UPI002FE5F7AD